MKDQDLVNALREHAEWQRGNEWETPITLGDDLVEAADRIANQDTHIAALQQEIEKLRAQLPRWIPVTERLPKPETEVMIVCNDNGRRFIATAIHENGKQLSEESCWVWTDIWEYGRYDEEHDDYFVPEGWWESRCFTPDDVYNCMVDCEVTHWMPMPELPEEKNNGNK